MSHASFQSPLGRSGRLACTVAAAVCAAGLQVTLLTPFHLASADTWVNPSPLVAQALARCNSLPRVAERNACTGQVAASARTTVIRSAMAGEPLAAP